MSNNILKITFDASTINGTIVKDMKILIDGAAI